ncbi:MAG: hypothetical protein V4760_07040 [Bdellovibrionota bacterium]
MRTFVLLAATVLCLGTLLGTSKAEATPVVEVTCYGDDCFKNGWLATYPRANFWAQAICWKKDCSQYGWQVHDSRGLDTDVTCVGRGCFVDGWIESVAQGRQSQYYKCKAPIATPNGGAATPDCWLHGFEANGPSVFSSASCVNGSCRTSGWVTKVGRLPDATTVCKTGADQTTGMTISDCFRFGWNVYQ